MLKKVYFSPSGLLHQISFSAIPCNDTMLLSDKYDLVYLSSSANLANPKSSIIDFSASDMVLYGGLNYDLSSDEMLANAKKYKETETEGFICL